MIYPSYDKKNGQVLTAPRDTAIQSSVMLSVILHHSGGAIIKSEHEIQNEILLALSKNGATVCRSNAGKVRTQDGRTIALFPKGWPDITGFDHHSGKMILIEVKNERGKLREDQQRFKEFINQYPVLYGVARSVEDALKIIEEE